MPATTPAPSPTNCPAFCLRDYEAEFEAGLDGLAPRALARTLNDILARGQAQLDEVFHSLAADNSDSNVAAITELVRIRAVLVDFVLQAAWKRYSFAASDDTALLAVGGYGRGELHPHSDIDILVLHRAERSGSLESELGEFISLLWDLGLRIGHSMRTPNQAMEYAHKDVGVMTNLLELRLVAGSERLTAELQQRLARRKILWRPRPYYRAKLAEQAERHAKYEDTEYNLEPNVKSSPGGLRDLQIIGWVVGRHLGMPCGSNYENLLRHNFLTLSEHRQLIGNRNFLWKVRYALHLAAGREEERLLFEFQRQIATDFGYRDDASKLAVEKFTARYYRCALEINELNRLLMRALAETQRPWWQPDRVQRLNARFQVRNHFIEVRDPRVFERQPSALLEIYVLMGRYPAIRGIHANTLRMIRQWRHLIDDRFRQDPVNAELFMRLLRSPNKLVTQLERMKRFGVLGLYLPEFGKVVGQMQHDLFHIYTVDAHSLQVLRHLRRLQYPEALETYPEAARLIHELPKLELLYIAGLYHDIGKGRGGDHSILGAEDVRRFGERHALPPEDVELIGWLVENHLLMSGVAQRKDISDPEVIRDFATRVSTPSRLDYLYILTVADITATNPRLWNSWRASLLRELYTSTRRALRLGLPSATREERIRDHRRQAREQLLQQGMTAAEIERIWQDLGDEYFLRETPDSICWHSQVRAAKDDSDLQRPLILIREVAPNTAEGGTEIFIQAPNRRHFFAATVAALSRQNLGVVDARVITSADGRFCLNSFRVLETDGVRIGAHPELAHRLKRALRTELSRAELNLSSARRHTPRRLKSFAIPTRTRMEHAPQRGLSTLEIIAADRPGLLAQIGIVFARHGVFLHDAKITTLGDRVEDIFYISTQDGKPFADPEGSGELQLELCRELDLLANA